MKTLFFMLAGVCLYGQVTTIQETDQVSASRTTINTNFSYLQSAKVGRWSGTGAPGTVALSILGDVYLDTLAGDVYQCFALGPCTTVSAGNWVKITNTNTGNFSGPNSASDSQLVLFSGTSGRLGKAATISGMLKLSGGVASAGVVGTDYEVPLTFSLPLLRSSNTVSCPTCTTNAAGLNTNQLLFGLGSNAIAVGDLTGDVTTSGGKTTTIGALRVLNSMLAGNITEGKFSFTDVATANASTLAHGLLPKLTGSNVDCFLGDGTFGSCLGGGSGANTTLSNLGSTNLNASLFFQSGLDLGSGSKPVRNLYLYGQGTYGTNYFKFDGTPTAVRTLTFPDATGTVALTTSSISGNAGTATALAANGTNCSAGQPALGVDASGNGEGCGAITDAQLSTSDVNTNNASTSKHGFVPKLPNDATKYYDGTGSYSTPPGTGGAGSTACLPTKATNTATVPATCAIKIGSENAPTVVGATPTVTSSGGTGTIFIGLSSAGVYSAWHNVTATCGAGLTCVGSTSLPPSDAYVFASIAVSSGAMGTITDMEASFTFEPLAPGTNVTLAKAAGVTTITSSAVGSGSVLQATVTLTAAQVNALVGTPQTLIAAPGANKILNVLSITMRTIVSTAFTVPGGASFAFLMGGGTYIIASEIGTQIGAASTSVTLFHPAVVGASSAAFTNGALTLTNYGGTDTTVGTGSTVTFVITYTVDSI